MEISALSAEERARLTPEQIASVLEQFDVGFQLTPKEKEQRALASTLAAPTEWRTIVASCIPHVVASFTCGDLDFYAAAKTVHRISVGCLPQARVQLIGLTVMLLLARNAPKRKRGQRPPPWPLWIQNATAALILEGQARNPALRRTPAPAYEETTSPLIAWALDKLIPLGWFGDGGVPKPSTVDDWVRKWIQTRPPAGTTS